MKATGKSIKMVLHIFFFAFVGALLLLITRVTNGANYYDFTASVKACECSV